MILKGSQRGGGQNLAVHLMRVDENEHVLVHELRGFASDNLKDAFKEAEAVARGTRCKQYLFSLSLNPPEDARLSVAEFETALDRIEKRLGLEGQPRAVVFHEKEGRRHAHAVWSRIDPETMTARQMSFFKDKLLQTSRELYLDHGWEMPRGIAQRGDKNPLNFSLAEWQQAKRLGTDPRLLRETVQSCWSASDNGASFTRALFERGLFLAKGDKRSFVVVDYGGEVHALPRLLNLKTKQVAERIGSEKLGSIAEAKADLGQRMTPAIKRHIADAKDEFRARASELGKAKETMTLIHRLQRLQLAGRQDLEWQNATRERAARLPTGLRGLWHRITGKYQEVRRQNEDEALRQKERQVFERERLIDAQRDERAGLQAEINSLRSSQAKRLNELRKEVGRFLRFTKAAPSLGAAEQLSRGSGLGLALRR
ncbi:MAG: relaxase/mobilization nuclease domain-containing protein [Alsobacter sp.]